MSELTVCLPDGSRRVAVVRDYFVDFEGPDMPSLRLDMCQQATNAIKREWPAATVWYGEKRLA